MALTGIKVLDLTRVLAGPFCTMMLGDLGASVVKVEEPKHGDETRNWGPPFAPSNTSARGESAYFLGINRNKRSIAINIKSTQGKNIIKSLVKNSDVLVENFVPGKMEELGLGFDEMKKINPRLIYATISGYGPTGPFAHRAGYDVVIEGEAGLMHITGEADGNPCKVGVAITDITTGLYAKSAIIAALFAREKTGKGQKVDISLLESQVSALANIGSNWLIANQEGTRRGTSHPAIVPYQSFETANGRMTIGAGNDAQYQKLCSAISRNDLVCDRYSSNAKRVINRIDLIDELEKTLKTKTTEEWLRKLEFTGIPFGPVNNIQQTFEHPQVIYRKMIETIDHPTAGKIKVAGIPVKYSLSKPSIRRHPPLHGEHTVEVLSELGLSHLEIEKVLENQE